MKCECDECEGTGKVACEDCNGTGDIGQSIVDIVLRPGTENYDEIAALKEDAHRVTSQAKELKLLNPARAESYDAQLKATLLSIEKQAEKLFYFP